MRSFMGLMLVIASLALVWGARSRNGIRVSWLENERAEVAVGMLFTGGSMLGLRIAAGKGCAASKTERSRRSSSV